MDTALIITGPPGSGKSRWVQEYAKKCGRQLFVCPCRKDRTLRDGRQKLHLWGRRTEPAILWLEGADDLTPEAQAFLRRILETHAPQVQFILECRDSSKLQDPIRSRCSVRCLHPPTWQDFIALTHDIRGVNMEQIKKYMLPYEYSYRTIQHCIDLQLHFPDIWKTVFEHRMNEIEASKDVSSSKIEKYIESSFNPETLFYLYNLKLPMHEKIHMLDYGDCLERSGSLWAFLGYALP